MGATFSIKTLNNISEEGLRRLPKNYKSGPDINDADAILVRSAAMHDMQFDSKLKAIARAGAGVNNIPVAHCTERGIVVFNTPGANANAVKELVLAGMLLSSRRIHQGIAWVQSMKEKETELRKLVEKKKSEYQGPELLGKTLGVIGLGAIGMLVANAADALSMHVVGYDPYISVDSAWKLSKTVEKARSLEALLATSDYVTIHVPLADGTKGFIDKSKLAIMKRGARLLNFAREELVVDDALVGALKEGRLSCYVTDFPSARLLGNENVIAIPHLGASTPESEANCAVMAVDQVREFLENGNIRNSVNFPAAEMPRGKGARLIIANKNVPTMVGKITSILAEYNINIADLLNKHRDEIAYNIIDVDGSVTEQQVDKIRQVEGILLARILEPVA